MEYFENKCNMPKTPKILLCESEKREHFGNHPWIFLCQKLVYFVFILVLFTTAKLFCTNEVLI